MKDQIRVVGLPPPLPTVKVHFGARLCKNPSSRIARRKSFSISSARKTKSTDDRYRRKTREKTMLRVLGSRTFSHGVGRTPRSDRGPANGWKRRYRVVRSRVGEGRDSTRLGHSLASSRGHRQLADPTRTFTAYRRVKGNVRFLVAQSRGVSGSSPNSTRPVVSITRGWTPMAPRPLYRPKKASRQPPRQAD